MIECIGINTDGSYAYYYCYYCTQCEAYFDLLFRDAGGNANHKGDPDFCPSCGEAQ
jgi:hypothetical protein